MGNLHEVDQLVGGITETQWGLAPEPQAYKLCPL